MIMDYIDDTTYFSIQFKGIVYRYINDEDTIESVYHDESVAQDEWLPDNWRTL